MNQVLKKDLTFVILSLNYVDIITWIPPFIGHLIQVIRKIKSSHNCFTFYDSLNLSSYIFFYLKMSIFFILDTRVIEDFIGQKRGKKASKFLKQ